MDAALRGALNEALSESLDSAIVAQIVADSTQVAAAAAATFATYRSSLVYDQLDGRFASTEADIRLLVGSATAASMASHYRTATGGDASALDSLRQVTSGVRISAHIAAVAAKKQDVIVRRGSRDDAAVAIWDSVALIPDEITKAGTGEIVLTAVMLAAFKITRTNGFSQIQVQHA